MSDRLEAAGRSNDHLVAIHRNAGAYPAPDESGPVFAALTRAFPGLVPAPAEAAPETGAAEADEWPDDEIVWAAGPG